MLELNKIHHGDCLELMKEIPDQSIDMILCDLPYGTTACKWDVIVPFDLLWQQYLRIVKKNTPIVLFGSQPFTSKLINSNLSLFRYCWVWEKTIASNFAMVKKQPAKKHEDIAVFYQKQPTYNPQMETGKPYTDKPRKRSIEILNDALPMKKEIINKGTRYPSSIQKFNNPNNKNQHPTQKPVQLLEYLILTYSNENDIVLDNCIGAGSTAIAAINTNRQFIGIEKELKYVTISNQRIYDHNNDK